MTIKGGCRCGAVRYELAEEEPVQAYACHCLDCQTWSGSAFGLHALLPSDAIRVGGPLIDYVPEGADTSPQFLCSICHTRVYNTNPAAPGLAVLRAGTLDDSQSIEPIAHIWTARMQPWIYLPEGVATFQETPTPAEFMEAIARR
jgi:hypothetical protein